MRCVSLPLPRATCLRIQSALRRNLRRTSLLSADGAYDCAFTTASCALRTRSRARDAATRRRGRSDPQGEGAERRPYQQSKPLPRGVTRGPDETFKSHVWKHSVAQSVGVTNNLTEISDYAAQRRWARRKEGRAAPSSPSTVRCAGIRADRGSRKGVNFTIAFSFATPVTASICHISAATGSIGYIPV